MKSVAIIIATQYGQTERIARAMRAQIVSLGMNAEVFKPRDNGGLPSIDLDDFETVILGAPVYAGKFPPSLVNWTDDHIEDLNTKVTAFFSVSLNAADKRAEARAADRQLLSDFIRQTGLKPQFTASIAGMLHYTKYGFLKRWLLKRISKAAGGPTDTSRDHEMTDWSQVSAFVDAILKREDTSSFAAQRPPTAPDRSPKASLR